MVGERLEEWDKPLLRLLLKQLELHDPKKVAELLKKGEGVRLCSGYSYGWTIWLTVQRPAVGGPPPSPFEEEAEEVELADSYSIDLWKGVETDFGISDEVVEGVSCGLDEVDSVIDEAKKMLEALIAERIPKHPRHRLEKIETIV